MTDHFLSKIPLLGRFADERFLDHRLRSTSLAGIAGCLVAVGLFEYRLFRYHIISWDLLAVVSSMALVKVSMMVWYGLSD